MDIIYSNHAMYKINVLKKHGIEIDKKTIQEIVSKPEKLERGYENRFIAQSKLNETHVLRVIYEEMNNCKLIITIYPGRIKRYD